MATDLGTMARGDDKTITIAVSDAGGAVDLTGTTLWFTAKRSLAEADPGLFQKRTGSGITHRAQVGADLGKADVAIAPADTAGLPAFRTTLLWDVQLVDGATGKVYTVASGTLTVDPDATIGTA
jgi:hypothetical protein